MIKIVALDVDGVILDSAHENFVVCQKVLKERGENLEDTLENDFRKVRCFLRSSSKSMFSIAKLTMQHTKCDALTQGEFEKFAVKHRSESIKFSEEFFETRKKLQSEDYERWFSLNSIFPGIKDAVEQLSKEFHLAVMSTKDFYSINRIFDTEGIAINKQNIFSKELSENKTEQLKIMCRKLSAKPSEIFFVDDQLRHLEETRELGTKVALAGWGYNNDKQKENATRLDIPVIKTPVGIEAAVREL